VSTKVILDQLRERVTLGTLTRGRIFGRIIKDRDWIGKKFSSRGAKTRIFRQG
jgi:hypothetical protein